MGDTHLAGEGLYNRLWTRLTRCKQAFRRLNAVTVPKVVSVPKSEAEEKKKE